MMEKYESEFSAMVNFNKDHPDRFVVLVIDEFNGDYWFERNGEKLNIMEEHEVIMCGDI